MDQHLKPTTILLILLFFGALIGLIMHRSRFCFVRAFRCPFMTGDAEMVKIVAMSLMIYGMGTAVIKWAWIQEPSMGVNHNFWIGSLLGGVIFGIGMLLAGGCALYLLRSGQFKGRARQLAIAHCRQLDLQLEMDKECTIWRFPIETISLWMICLRALR